MYKSPISIYETAIQTIMEQRENAIFAKVQDAFDVQVDKKELIRALQYDRGQYEKGYKDGKADAAPKWIPVGERLPEGDKVVLCYKADRGIRFGKLLDATYANGVQAFMDRDRVFAFGATHWMPLPEPPNE